MNSIKQCFDGVSVEIDATDNILQIFSEDYQDLPKSKTSGLKFIVMKDRKQDYGRIRLDFRPKNASLKNSMLGHLGYVVSADKNPLFTKNAGISVFFDPALVNTTPLTAIVGYMYRSIEWNYLTRLEVLCKNLIYDVIEPVVHGNMIHKMSSFLHASGIERNGKSIIFTGEGSSGKTSLCLEFMNGNWNFMSDDLIIINSSGISYPYTKKMQIYPYNTEGSNEIMEKIMHGAGAVNKIQWKTRKKIFGMEGVRRRVSPRRLFGSRIGKTSRICNVFHLSRGEHDKISSEDIAPDELAGINEDIIYREFVKFFSAYESAGLEPSCKVLMNKTRKIYKNAFSKASLNRILIPEKSHAGDVRSFLEDNFL